MEEPRILRPERTEKAKQLRRMGVETFANRTLKPASDGVSNTITSVLKDNLLLEPVTCASRKRGDIHKLEFGGDVANALTSIGTDSMVAVPISFDTADGTDEIANIHSDK